MSAAILTSCSKKQIPCYRADNLINVDGISEDWEKCPLTYSEEHNFSYGACNDSAFIYLALRMNDRQLAMRIKRSGVTFYVDEKGGKNKTAGFNFRDENAFGRMNEIPQFKMRREDFTVDDKFGRGKFKATLMIGEMPDLSYSNFDMTAPQGAFNTENGLTCFEFRIPVKMNDSDCEYNLLKARKPVIGIIVSGMNRDMMPGGRGPGGMPPGGGGGGMGRPDGGGGMRPGGMGGGPGMMPQFDKEIEIWCRLEFLN